MTDFAFNTPPRIQQCWGGAAQLGDLVDSLPSVREGAGILFVTDPGIMKLGLTLPALVNLEKAGYQVVVYDQIEADPKATTILDAVDAARSKSVTCVIGFGGGSSMDAAKLASLLLASDQELEDIYGVNQATGPRLPLILVPTTAGTGSEVTAVSIVTTGESEKKGVVSPCLLPDIALLDAELTLGLPPHITAATGIDAMVHAIEAFTSRNANNNPISRNLAKQALKLLGVNIRDAVFQGENLTARSNMLLGAMLAGQAFANSPVAGVHALAYPIGSLFHVPHGLSNSLVLCQVMQFNAPGCGDEYAELAPCVFPDINLSRSNQAVCSEFIERLSALSADLGLETCLKGVGIVQDDIEQLATDAMKQSRLLINNPRKINLGDAQAIYRKAL
ncbi:MAG: iron-containing alcohol dehydrogenase [Proteobacteria bacterium]|nr:iron-containing alcohol dehydrogenase [Pseudomonadota bacterium]